MAKIKSINQLLVRMLATTMIFLILFSGIGAAVGPLETVFNDNNPLKILKNDGDATKYPTSRYFGFDNSNISMEVNMTQSGLEVYGEIGIIDENSSPIPGAFVADEDFDEFNFTDIGGGSYHYLNYTLPPTEENFWAIMIYVGESTGNNTNMSNGADGRPDPFIIVMNLNPKDFPLLGDNTTDWTEIEDFTNATLNFEGLDVDDDMTILGTLGYLELLDPINMCNNDTQNALMELGNYLDIDEGNMSLDSEALFALNVSSRLTMYDLEFDGTPGILMDGVLEYNGTSANNMISNFTWYAGNGTLVFEVEHWTSYYADGVGPTVTPITPQGTAVFNDDTLSLNVSASDLSGVASVTVNISNVNDTLTTAILSQDGDYWTNNSIIVNTRNTGTLSMQVNATDTLGISNTGVSLTVSKATFTHDVADGESIQAAINAANFSDTINVASDTYKENIVVNATGLILIGTGMPVVDAMGLGNAVEVTADGVTINGFNATNATYGPDSCGFLIESNNNTLTGNAANNNDYGIYLTSSSNNTLTGNNVDSNTEFGIGLSESSNNILTNNIANDNNGEGFGIYLSNSNNNTLTENNANDNDCFGIYMDTSNNNMLTNNIANNNGKNYGDYAFGIYLESSSYNTLYKNIMYNNNYANAIDTDGENNWNSSSLGNYYDLIYQTYTLSESEYSWVNTTQSDSDWDDVEDDDYSSIEPIGFDFTLDGVTYTDMQIMSNGVIQLIPAGGSGLYDYTYTSSPIYWSNEYPDETFIFALCDDLYPDGGNDGWYGYTTYTIGDNDSGNTPITQNLTVIDYHVSIYSNYNYSNYNYLTNPNDYQVVLYENGMLRFNFKNLNYTMFPYELYSGIYLGSDSSTHAKETIHVARAGQYSNETSYSTPIIRTLSSTYDVDGIGIGDKVHLIGDEGVGSGTGIDYFPLVTASKASSSATSSTLSFTVSTTLIDHASVGVDNIALYYKKGSGAWTKYADSTTGTFTFTAPSEGDYYFYTVATDTYGMVEGVPSVQDSKTTVNLPDTSSGGVNLPTPLPDNVVNNEVRGTIFNEPVNSAELVFKNGDVLMVTVDAEGTMSEIMLTVQKLADKPSGVTAPPVGGVHSYMDIGLGRITNDDITGATIQFKVDKKWLSENGGDKGAIVLMRFHDVWEILETTVESEDGEYYYFSARTPGFSTFAIAVTGEGGVTAVDDTTTPAEVLDDTKPVTQIDVESDTDEKASGLPGFSIIMGILGIVSAILVRKK